MMAAIWVAYGTSPQPVRATTLGISTQEGSIPARLLAPEEPQGLVVHESIQNRGVLIRSGAWFKKCHFQVIPTARCDDRFPPLQSSALSVRQV